MKILKKILKKIDDIINKNLFEELSDVVLYLCGNEALPLPLDPEEETILIEEMKKGNLLKKNEIL